MLPSMSCVIFLLALSMAVSKTIKETEVSYVRPRRQFIDLGNAFATYESRRQAEAKNFRFADIANEQFDVAAAQAKNVLQITDKQPQFAPLSIQPYSYYAGYGQYFSPVQLPTGFSPHQLQNNYLATLLPFEPFKQNFAVGLGLNQGNRKTLSGGVTFTKLKPFPHAFPVRGGITLGQGPFEVTIAQQFAPTNVLGLPEFLRCAQDDACSKKQQFQQQQSQQQQLTSPQQQLFQQQQQQLLFPQQPFQQHQLFQKQQPFPQQQQQRSPQQQPRTIMLPQPQQTVVLTQAEQALKRAELPQFLRGGGSSGSNKENVVGISRTNYVHYAPREGDN